MDCSTSWPVRWTKGPGAAADCSNIILLRNLCLQKPIPRFQERRKHESTKHWPRTVSFGNPHVLLRPSRSVSLTAQSALSPSGTPNWLDSFGLNGKSIAKTKFDVTIGWTQRHDSCGISTLTLRLRSDMAVLLPNCGRRRIGFFERMAIAGPSAGFRRSMPGHWRRTGDLASCTCIRGSSSPRASFSLPCSPVLPIFMFRQGRPVVPKSFFARQPKRDRHSGRRRSAYMTCSGAWVSSQPHRSGPGSVSLPRCAVQ